MKCIIDARGFHAITFFTKARSAHEGHESLLDKIIFVIFLILRAFVISLFTGTI